MPTPVALITGGTRGIGRAIAQALAPTHHLLIGGRDADGVATVCRDLPQATPWVADLADEASVSAALDRVDRCDVLIHSAGLAAYARVEEQTRTDWRTMFEVNLFAVAQVTTALLPHLRATQGQVITINSGAGFSSPAGSGLYAATKFALRAFTDALRAEEPQLRITSIHPGRTATDMQAALWKDSPTAYDPAEHLDPVDVAATVRLAVDLPRDSVLTELSVRPRVSKNP